MGEKTAGIKVNVKGDKSGIRELENETKRAAGGMKAALRGALDEGLKGGTDAVKGLLSDVKGLAGTFVGLVGGFGLAEITKQALEARSKFSDLSAGIRFAGGTAADAKAATDQAQKSALAWAQDSMKVADAFTSIRDETGDLGFAQSSIDTISIAARGAHKELGSVAAITGTLNEKFGITSEELPDALADVVGLSAKGGVGFEDMAEKLGLIGAYAKEGGLQGREGLGQIVGMLNLADNANGSFKKGISAVGGLLEQLGNAAGKAKIGSALGISGRDMGGNVVQQIEAIMRATKGQKSQLEKAFGGEQLKLLVDLGKTYSQAFDETKGSVKDKSAAALAALRDSFTDASKSTVTWADIQKEASSSMNEAPQKIATATEKLRQAFQSEKMQAALGKIIDRLPQLAELIAKIADFAADNPLGAGAAVIGGTFAKGALTSAIEAAFKSGAAAAGPSLASAMAGSASPFAASLAPLMGPIGLALGASIAIMLVASLKEAEREKERQRARAEDAQKMLKGGKGPLGGAYQAAGALEAATGIEMDPSTAISADTAARATANQDEADKVMQERLDAQAKRGRDMLDLGNKLAGKYGWNGPQMTPAGSAGVTSVDAGAGGYSGTLAPGVPAPAGARAAAPAAPAAPITWDPQLLAQMMSNGMASKELKVRVTNPNDIGGSAGPAGGGPTGGGPVTPGFRPRW